MRASRFLCALPALALLAAAPASTRATDPTPAVATMPHISIVAIGRGSPVVLIPGLASPRAVWAAVAPQIARGHRVLLVQVNGFGGDDPGANLAPGVLAGIVADLHDYLVRNRAGSAAVIGHSMGGLVGLMLAKAHPTDVSRLMIVDALPYFAVLMAPPGVDPTPAMVAPQAATMRDRVAAAYGRPLDPDALAAQTRGLALSADGIAKLKEWAGHADARVTGQAMYEDLTTDLRPDLAGIATPITLVFPWSSAGPARETAERFYRRQYATAPHVTFLPVAGSAHFVMLDQPTAFAAAVADFLNCRVAPAAG